jgi:hypothetical protein
MMYLFRFHVMMNDPILDLGCAYSICKKSNVLRVQDAFFPHQQCPVSFPTGSTSYKWPGDSTLRSSTR